MLIINKNLDFDVLLDYGFIFRGNLLYKPSSKDRDLIDISINQETREVSCTGILGRSDKLDLLYDLIINNIITKID